MNKIFILDQDNKKVSIKVGDVIVGYTGLKGDAYKPTDPQVLSGQREDGEAKVRYGLVLSIYNENNVDIIFATNISADKFPAKNKKGNRDYLFCSQTIRNVNPQKDKVILKKSSNDYQLKEPELVLDKILSSTYYLRFEKQKIERRIKEELEL